MSGSDGPEDTKHNNKEAVGMLAMQGGGSGSSMPCSDYPINHGMVVQIMHPVAVLDWMAGRCPRAPSVGLTPTGV
jgi:hypothetical protein